MKKKTVMNWAEIILGTGLAIKGAYDLLTDDDDDIIEAEVVNDTKGLECKSKYANMEAKEKEVVKEGESKDGKKD